MEPKIGETFVFGDVDPVKFPNKTIFTVKEVETDWVVLSSQGLTDWHVQLSKFLEHFTKV